MKIEDLVPYASAIGGGALALLGKMGVEIVRDGSAKQQAEAQKLLANADMQRVISDAFEKLLEGHQRQLATTQGELERTTQQLRLTNDRLEESEKTNQRLEGEIADLKAEVEKYRKAVERLEARLDAPVLDLNPRNRKPRDDASRSRTS